MKSKKHSKKPPPGGTERPAEKSKPVASVLSGRRLWLARIALAVFVPLLLLGGIELVLRLSGFGYPTSFFIQTVIGNHTFYVTNEKFGYRFFPPALARTPLALRMPALKATNEYRIFLFGESAAQGDPDPSFGVGRYLEVLLRERYPGTDFKVVCAAMTAINSHAILPIARECARHDGDLWIVYMGNNEMVGPFGGGTVFGRQAPPDLLVRTALAAKTTKTVQAMTEFIGRFKKPDVAPKAWDGLNMFKEHQLRNDDSNRLRAYDNFRDNLADILSAAHSAGVPVLVSTVADNLKDCAPFASLHSASLDNRQKIDWDGYYQTGAALETNGEFPAALEQYMKAAALDSSYAELQFRMGRCHLALTNLDMARCDFTLARDDDALVFRADTRINQIISETVAKHASQGAQLVNAADILARQSPDGIPGNEFFYEHVHFDFAGNYLLARAFADAAAKLLPVSITSRKKGDWASEEFCDQRLAVSPWDRYRLWQMNFSRVTEPPFTEQLNSAARNRMYMAKLKDLQTTMTSDSAAAARTNYQAAVTAAPEDDLLHGNFAQFLEETGDLPAAIQEQKRVCELLPCYPAPLQKVGVLLVRDGKTADAAGCFAQALALKNDYVPALNELGLLRANEGKISEATNYYYRAIRANPGYVETYFNFGFLEQSAGQVDQALTHYQVAAQLQPDGPAAYFNQAVELSVQHHRDAAINSFRTAVYMYPGFWQARYLLGVELAFDKQLDEAQAQFAEVVRLRPDLERGHMNLGVALAKQGKLDEAIKEFQATLQLSPTNKAAQQYLQSTEILKMRKQRS